MLTQPDSLLRYMQDASGLALPDGHFIDGKGWKFPGPGSHRFELSAGLFWL